MLRTIADQANRFWNGDLTPFGAPPIDDYTAGRLRAEQIGNVVRYTPAMMMANIFNAIVMVVAMWDTPMSASVHLWAFALITMCIYIYLRRRGDDGKHRPKSASPAGIRRASVYSVVLGLLWSVVPIAFFADSSYQGQLIIICLSTGMICAGAFVLATIPSAAIAFTSPIVVGFAATVLQMPQPVYTLVAALTLVYAFVLTRAVATHSLHLVQRVTAQVESELAAHTDALTGLPNRVAFREELNGALSRLARYGEGFGVFYIDLDDFKSVNDELGHAAGDELLAQSADRMKACLRDIDCVARLAGDEFAIVAAAIKEPSQAMVVAERLVRSFSAPFNVGGTRIISHISIGIAIAPFDGLDAETLLKKADTALYSSKRDRRGQFQFFQSELDAQAQQKLAMERELREAIANRELYLEYQPFVDLRTRQIAGFEALLRWRHPQRGAVCPLDFIPVAEKTGMIQEIGEFVLGEALREAAGWPDHLRISVNFSPEQFRSMSLLPVVLGLLKDSGLPPPRLEIEITESAAVAESQQAIAILQALRSAGVRIALDDFGTGYSSLNYLRKLPLDRIKIDRTFIADMLDAPECASIVKAVIGLAADLGMQVTAEGVETEVQFTFLKSLNCNEAQGYLISRPMAPADIRQLLEQQMAESRAA
jgi:diguanylate cyclase (GGDEF)-like protein